MYESPINVIYGEMQTQIEGDVYKAIQNVGIDVNKEELIKALQYDRNQYSKGYSDAISEFAERLSLEISESIIWDMLVSCDKDKNFNETSDKIIDYINDTVNKIADEMIGEE